LQFSPIHVFRHMCGTQIAAKLMQPSIDYCGSKEMGGLNLRRGALGERGRVEGREQKEQTIQSLLKLDLKENDTYRLRR
jgi:hypothetical protein